MSVVFKVPVDNALAAPRVIRPLGRCPAEQRGQRNEEFVRIVHLLVVELVLRILPNGANQLGDGHRSRAQSTIKIRVQLLHFARHTTDATSTTTND